MQARRRMHSGEIAAHNSKMFIEFSEDSQSYQTEKRLLVTKLVLS